MWSRNRGSSTARLVTNSIRFLRWWLEAETHCGVAVSSALSHRSQSLSSRKRPRSIVLLASLTHPPLVLKYSVPWFRQRRPLKRVASRSLHIFSRPGHTSDTLPPEEH